MKYVYLPIIVTSLVGAVAVWIFGYVAGETAAEQRIAECHAKLEAVRREKATVDPAWRPRPFLGLLEEEWAKQDAEKARQK